MQRWPDRDNLVLEMLERIIGMKESPYFTDEEVQEYREDILALYKDED